MQGGCCVCWLPGYYSFQLCSLMPLAPASVFLAFPIPCVKTRDGTHGDLPWLGMHFFPL